MQHRLNRIEEGATFNERAIEELTAQMLDLDRRLRRVMSRLEGLESQVASRGLPIEPDRDGPAEAPAQHAGHLREGRWRLTDPPE